ncbi:uncharacterized protein LOC135717134 [Ochlerotatus camptorhynchus]|uniref:uncharacterized protein LOC135717134 n=1 Tax=Ochlerotatus camptorhynchus TaxID=644619 RepID=UPI0031D06F5D
MAEVKTLVHLRGQAKAKVTRIRKAVEEAYGAGARQLSMVQLKVFTRNLEMHYQEYCDIHRQIVALTPAEKLVDQDETYILFEDQHNEVCMLVETLIQLMTEPQPRPMPSSQREGIPRIIVQQQPLKAPIPTFDGKPENWPRFKAMFLDVMRTSTDSDAIKLYHLDKALIGNAAGIIDVCTLNENNYAGAWELLEERFENKRLIVDTHILGLLSLKKMNRTSAKDLRELVDEVSRHIDGLKLMDEVMNGMSERFVVNLLATALDAKTRMEWESTVPHKQIPTYKDTMEFLKKRCAIRERCEDAIVKPPVTKPSVPSKNQVKSISTKAFAVTGKESCDVCGTGAHPNFKCEIFRAMTVVQRQAKSALKSNVPNVQYQSVPKESQSNSAVSRSLKQPPRLSHSLLMTARVQIKDSDGNLKYCRAFLDCGSQAHLTSRSLVKSLNLPRFSTNVEVVGANGQRSTLSEMVRIEIRSCNSNYAAQLECLVADKVTGPMPSVPFDIRKWNIPPNLPLADPEFHIPGEIDLLIGIQLFFKLLLPGQVKMADELPILQETRLGWVVAGSIEESHVAQHCYSVGLQSLAESMEKFWSIESVDSCNPLTNEEQLCEEIFCSTTHRDQNGRYIVQLPLKDSIHRVEDNRSIALRRFFMLEQRFLKNPELKKQYAEFINEYKSLGHCIQIDESQDPPKLLKYYVPHHAVLKPTSSSTKLRVVFDASSKGNGPSLNDALMIGPVVQEDILTINLRFQNEECGEAAHCINCGGPHRPNNRQCPVYKKETDVIRIKVDRNLTYPEARKQVEAGVRSYAAAAAQPSADRQ